jgi:tRNA (guanine-N7-)-methyltransferase
MQNYIDYRKVEKPLNIHNFTVEIGFGSGDYLLNLASENRDEVFFGIEKSWISVSKLLKKCGKANVKNVFCTRLDAYWAFQLLFLDGSIKRVIINYPDPWFKKAHEYRRLTKKENLYIYAKKLMSYGEIKIRTDDYFFVKFTLQECQIVNAFSITISNPKIDEPLTKYEKKWLSMNKDILDMILIKEKEPNLIKTMEIKEMRNLFPVVIKKEKLNIKDLCNKEFKIEEGLYLKCFSVWQRDEDYAIEVLLSEKGFLQTFIITIQNKGRYNIMNVSQFSEIVKTEGVKKSIYFLSKILKGEIK